MEDRDTQGTTSTARRGQIARLVVLVAVLALAIALALDNRQDVTLSWLVGDAVAPLILALLVAFVLGSVVGWLGARRRWR